MRQRRGYTKGIKKYLVLFVLCIAVLEGLSLYFPMLLQNMTMMMEAGKTVADIVLYGLLILGFIILIFGVQFLVEFTGAIYGDLYQANIRKKLYDKFSKLSSDQIDQIGTARILPTMMNDSNWLKLNHRRIIQTCVYFPVVILGSIIMLFTLNLMYALIALASIPIVLLFFYLNMRHINKSLPQSIDAYDEFFLNIKEGITGAKDIRILGKADERAVEFEQHVAAQHRQWLDTQRAHNMSIGFTAVLFTVVTIAIIVFGSLANLSAEGISGIVILNTSIQYINKIWDGSHQIFIWFIDYLPRCRLTVKRHDKFYSMPEQSADDGLLQIPVYAKYDLNIQNISYAYPNSRKGLDDVSIFIPDGCCVAVAGGIGSGKSIISDILLKYKTPSEGLVSINEIDISQLNQSFWRRSLVSFCADSPQFIPGTIRDNIKLLSPDVRDEQILKVFKDIGAEDFVAKFANILDFEITENNVNDGTKNILNLVRAVLKPAEVYVFDQCFEHVKVSYIAKLIALLKKAKKTCIFITYDGTVCKHCDNIYVLKNGRISGIGRHAELMLSNDDYRNLHSSRSGVMQNEERMTESHAEEIHNVVETTPPEVVV